MNVLSRLMGNNLGKPCAWNLVCMFFVGLLLSLVTLFFVVVIVVVEVKKKIGSLLLFRCRNLVRMSLVS